MVYILDTIFCYVLPSSSFDAHNHIRPPFLILFAIVVLFIYWHRSHIKVLVISTRLLLLFLVVLVQLLIAR